MRLKELLTNALCWKVNPKLELEILSKMLQKEWLVQILKTISPVLLEYLCLRNDGKMSAFEHFKVFSAVLFSKKKNSSSGHEKRLVVPQPLILLLHPRAIERKQKDL